jgi:hypothetical protein
LRNRAKAAPNLPPETVVFGAKHFLLFSIMKRENVYVCKMIWRNNQTNWIKGRKVISDDFEQRKRACHFENVSESARRTTDEMRRDCSTGEEEWNCSAMTERESSHALTTDYE